MTELEKGRQEFIEEYKRITSIDFPDLYKSNKHLLLAIIGANHALAIMNQIALLNELIEKEGNHGA